MIFDIFCFSCTEQEISAVKYLCLSVFLPIRNFMKVHHVQCQLPHLFLCVFLQRRSDIHLRLIPVQSYGIPVDLQNLFQPCPADILLCLPEIPFLMSAQIFNIHLI